MTTSFVERTWNVTAFTVRLYSADISTVKSPKFDSLLLILLLRVSVLPSTPSGR